ncbi:MAG: YihA family ribosome biogenesis GTP-binding protein [Flavobacteriales bacterium]|nr:YihA family ribosome biogenesis GTP-binding protein [Flavobacteriales bacterium]MCB9193021.1 YihA family ribosome biogenesis GTP-binding protein [Flavobacteriales bacterium]
MRNLRAEHLGSGREAAHWPKPTLPEYAFIGRSNVGKSSLINMLCGVDKLARVSNTPGRTRLVEHFQVAGTLTTDGPWLLADLPGYGFARVARTEREAWQRMVRTYLRERPNLQCVFLLVDVRLDPQRSDLDMIQWLGEEAIPFAIVFTKSDKLSPPKVQASVAVFRRLLKRTWNELPTMFITSADTREGRGTLLEFIDQVNADFRAT